MTRLSKDCTLSFQRVLLKSLSKGYRTSNLERIMRIESIGFSHRTALGYMSKKETRGGTMINRWSSISL
jgi:hypothetical protein